MRMRKIGNTRFSYKLDKLFWFFISFLPVISWLFYLFCFSDYGTQETSLISFANWFYSYIYGFSLEGNIVYQTLNNIFGRSGAFPFLSASYLNFFTYLVMIEIIHVFFDVIVFIPRLAHKWISKAVQDD